MGPLARLLLALVALLLLSVVALLLVRVDLHLDVVVLVVVERALGLDALVEQRTGADLGRCGRGWEAALLPRLVVDRFNDDKVVPVDLCVRNCRYEEYSKISQTSIN
jgi:hypothetical protein